MRFLPTPAIRPLLRETLGTPFGMVPITSGLLNQNLLVTTHGGAKFVFKAYRPEMPREKVGETHRLMAHAARRGIPVPLPVATYEIHGRAAALYPFVDGAHPPRYGVGVRRAESMGEMLGRVDCALDSFRPTDPKPSSLDLATWDPEKILREAGEIRASLKGRPRRVREDVEATLRMYEDILPKGDWDTARFARLPVRVCHGDYHQHNLLMKGRAVTAVLDWEKAGWNWRAFEVMRSVMFNCRRSGGTFCWDDVRAYLAAYRRHAALSDRERELTFDAGFNKAYFSLWSVKQYLAGNVQVRENMVRRATLMPYLFKNRAAFAERVAGLLR